MKDPYRSCDASNSLTNPLAISLRAIYPLLIFILSVPLTVFWVLYPKSGVLFGELGVILLLVFFLLSFIGSVVTIVYRALHPKTGSRRGFLPCAAALLRTLYPHLLFILSAMFVTFWVLEKYNPVMGFLTGSISMVLLLVFLLLSLTGSAITLVYRWKQKKH